jgi:putative ABC transport system permease protein
MICVVREGEDVLNTARDVQQVLSSLHDKRDYEVVVPLELLESRQSTQRVFDIVLPIIAGISLLVGGIGILNIMLASVTERTREIGIRRAIGASRADIVLQFLVETVALSGAAGLLGIAAGAAFVFALERFTEWQPVITGWSVALALIISSATGILFGIYPARRAALMDPIQALRHE